MTACLENNGWNKERGVFDGYPLWPRVIIQLSEFLSVMGSQTSVATLPKLQGDSSPTSIRGQSFPSVYVTVGEFNGESIGRGCSIMHPGGMMLQEALRFASLTALDLDRQGITSISMSVSDCPDACVRRRPLLVLTPPSLLRSGFSNRYSMGSAVTWCTFDCPTTPCRTRGWTSFCLSVSTLALLPHSWPLWSPLPLLLLLVGLASP